jgi:hypothetical protein
MTGANGLSVPHHDDIDEPALTRAASDPVGREVTGQRSS